MITNHLRYMKILHTLRNNIWLKTSELELIQMIKLRKMLNHSYRNVPFYCQLFDSIGVKPDDIKTIDDLYKIPIMTKSQFKSIKREIIAKNINLNDCIEESTSGSTGNPLTLIFSKEDSLYALASYDRVRIENGFRLFRDILLATGGPSHIPNSKSKKWYQYLGIARREGFNVFESLDVLVHILEEINPDVIWGYPSTIKLLAKYLQEKDIRYISPRLIFTASEVLDQETRKFINSAFNVELFDVYGSHETGCIAWECSKHSGYHISTDTVLTEFVDDKGFPVDAGKMGRVVVTNLHSYAMPIIRYEIGDFAIPTYEECSCGRGGYLMKTIDGRSNDVLITNKDKVIVSSFVPNLFYPNFTYSETDVSPNGPDCKQYQKIKQFQVIQKTKDEILIKIVKEPEVDKRSFDYVLTNFKNVFGKDIDIKLIFVDFIPPLSSGKNTYIISMINQNKMR